MQLISAKKHSLPLFLPFHCFRTVGVSSNVVTTNVGPTTSPPTHLVKTVPGGPPTVERAAPTPSALSISGPPERSPAIATVSSIQGAQVLTGAATMGAASALASAGGGVPTLPNLAAANHQTGQQQTNQPVEFNHAINYVNKIKVFNSLSPFITCLADGRVDF